MCEESNTAGAARREAHAELFKAAQHAAQCAYDECTPAAMLVYETEGLSDRPKVDGKAWYVSEGVCGFAAVIINPATSSFAKYLAKLGIGRRNYGGGWHVSVYDLVPASTNSQSYERKVAAASAACKVFNDAGTRAYVWDRLD